MCIRDSYLTLLHDLVARLDVPDVHFAGHVTNEELRAYYNVADVFLCASEHEGFCVPLVEAFYKRIPVIALARTAVPSTMDGAGLLYDEPDPEQVATLLDLVISDTALQERIIEGQDRALERLRARDFGGTLLSFIEGVLSSPRLPPHAVTPDFWQQVESADRIEALRIYRPSLYKGLPAAVRASSIDW